MTIHRNMAPLWISDYGYSPKVPETRLPVCSLLETQVSINAPLMAPASEASARFLQIQNATLDLHKPRVSGNLRPRAPYGWL